MLLAATLSGLAGGTICWVVLSPAPPASQRIRPYTWGARVAMGMAPDVDFVHQSTPAKGWLSSCLDKIGGWFTQRGSTALLIKINQAGWFADQTEEDQLVSYGLKAAKMVGAGLGVGITLGLVTGGSPTRMILGGGLGGAFGFMRHRGALDRAITERQRRMQIEIYTIDQILALHIRSGGSPVQAVQQVVDRGRGDVVGELAEALRLHRAGIAAGEAFRRLSETTPEKFCARSYLLLAAGEERGADLAAGLISLAEDGREARREALRRGAVKRRAAMLLPTIGILAPVLLLFIGAPLPYLVLNAS